MTGSDSTLFGAGPKQLAFVRDVDDPSLIRISIGGTIGMSGLYSLGGGALDPATITPASGRVVYRLFLGANSGEWNRGGAVARRNARQIRIRVEAFPGSQAATGEFTANALIYLAMTRVPRRRAPAVTRVHEDDGHATQMHEIDYKDFGDDMQFVEVELDPNEAAVAEAGGMMYMDDGIEMETIFGDGSAAAGAASWAR